MRMPVATVVAAWLVSGFGAGVAAAADCTPTRMVRITYVNQVPGMNPQSFAAQPKTIYRVGEKYGRIEERPDPSRGIHGLIVVQEPDIWVVNLLAKAGQHMVDPGPTFFFRASLVAGASPFMSGMEFGCELAYLKAAGAAPPRRATADGRSVLNHEATSGSERIVLTTDAATRSPLSVRFISGAREIVTVRYLDYRDDLPIALTLFARPEGIALAPAR